MLDLQNSLARVEQKLMEVILSQVELLQKSSRHIIGAGGKRFRPKIVLYSYQAVGGSNLDQIIPIAAAVELAHSATLVHDDINDMSDTRRGKPTVNALFGNTIALLTGDFLFTKLFELLADQDLKILRAFAEAGVALVEGEAIQIGSAGDANLKEKTYFELITKKTAVLFATCAVTGAIQGGGTDAEILALREYGINLGIGFQITDDLLDLVGDENTLGKATGKDLAQNKMNLATIYAAEVDRKTWEKVIKSADAQATMKYLETTGALSYAYGKADEHSKLAQLALAKLPESAAKHSLLEIAKLAVNRQN